MSYEPLIVSRYGWGRTLRLYRDYLELHNASYALTDLIYVYPTYRCIMGISSATLELGFKERVVRLRGIPYREDAQQIIAHLVDLGIANDLRTFSAYSEETHPEQNSPIRGEQNGGYVLPPDPETPTASEDHSLPHTPSVMYNPHQTSWQEEEQREIGMSLEELVHYLREHDLPCIQAPVILLPGEYAHYSTVAALYGESPSGRRYQYRSKDEGKLILTNKRMLFIGRKRYLVLDYDHITHVSRLKAAMAFMAEHWFQRQVFEMPHPQECTIYLEYILQKQRQIRRAGQREYNTLEEER